MHPFKERVDYLSGLEAFNIKSYAFYSQKGISSDEFENIKVVYERISKDRIEQIVPKIQENVFYFCGPLPYQSAVKQMLLDLGVKEENIRFESFGPTQEI
jgi:nitric oxide dioxygenase